MKKRFFKTKQIFDIPVANTSLKEIIPLINTLIETSNKKTFFGLNSHNLSVSLKNKGYKQALQKATMVYPEGIGTIIISNIVGSKLKGKTTLMDFIYEILSSAEKNKWSVYLLGGKPNIAKEAVAEIKKKFPKIKISGSDHGYFKPNQESSIIGKINKTNTDILFVALGSPTQELWIDRNLEKIKAKAFFGIGGSIDHLSGKIPRAPAWMHKHGLEWIFRLIKEPKRLWRRYLLENFILLGIVMKEVLSDNNNEESF